MFKATTLRLKDSVCKLEVSLKEWSEGKKSLGDVSKENNLSIWQVMDEAKKKGFSSSISLDDVKNNVDF
jgi:hypothetical protein